VLAVYEATRSAGDRARRGGGPQMIEVKTFRMKGHAEHDDAGYVPKELLEQWRQRDPIDRFERHLLAHGLAAQEDLDAIVAGIQERLDADLDFALASPLPPPERAEEGVYGEAGR
jgi:TPP-dependent pyruvate/acetoin dehydrogenase alpha subunit